MAYLPSLEQSIAEKVGDRERILEQIDLLEQENCKFLYQIE